MTDNQRRLTVGVLALQGAFSEHTQLLRKAFSVLEQGSNAVAWSCEEVRTPEELARCHALVIPGGESTTIALVAERSHLLEPLRQFVKFVYSVHPFPKNVLTPARVERKPTWGTCAGLILLAEAANHTKQGGQDLIGGLDVRVNRNHFGRQAESFETELDLPFLASASDVGDKSRLFHGVFIRAPVVEKILPTVPGVQKDEEKRPDTIIAPSQLPKDSVAARSIGQEIEVMGILPGRADALKRKAHVPGSCQGDIVAVRQGNCFGTSFHPELTNDERIHVWWLQQVQAAFSEVKDR